MQVFGVAGPAEERRTALDRIARHLGETGRVGVVRAEDDAEVTDGVRGARRTYSLDGDGRWTATGRDRTLADVLDELGVHCDYGIVLGRPEVDVPHLVVGEREVEGEVLLRTSDPERIDVEELRESIEGLEPRETLESLVRTVKRSPDEVYSGAIATFTGRVRAKDDPEDDYTEYLEFERYDDVVADRMDEIESTLESRDGVYEVLLHHRTGVMEAGEDIVFVVVLAGHRAEAFEAVEDGINRLKEVVPLFKKEVTAEEEFWAHERG